MEILDTREWLLTNGLGSFASGTVGDAHTRTYHGWLIAALVPPSQRTLLLSHIEASLDIGHLHVDLGTNYWGSGDISPDGYRWLQSFQSAPVPTWVWGDDQWTLSRQLLLPHGHSTVDNAHGGQSIAASRSGVLIHYRYTGVRPATLTLRPLIGDRHFHHQQHASNQLQFSQVVTHQHVLLQAIRPDWSGTPWCLRWTVGTYHPDGVWYWDYCYPEETRRGLGDAEDLYSPGYLVITLQPGEAITLDAQVGEGQSMLPPLTPRTFEAAIKAERDRLDQLFPVSSSIAPVLHDQTDDNHTNLYQTLLYAGDQFLAYRASVDGPTIMAGYPWFGDWGRDTLIALPGLALTTKRFSLARGLLQTFAQYCEHGLIPNAFPDQGAQPYYNSLDASLWWIETLGLYVELTQDWSFLAQQYPTVQRIYKSLMTGTLHNIHVDAVDGLLTWDSRAVALTWMDAVVDGTPITPRKGKAIEINALWYSCLCWARQWAIHLQGEARASGDGVKEQAFGRQIQRYNTQIDQVRTSLRVFWNPQRGYFYDTIQPNDVPDPSIRPNAIIALSLAHCGFSEEHGAQALELAHNRLLTPYGLRSLDPANPQYKGNYAGNVGHRDRAYHQGTVWSWLIGPFIRAWKRFHGDRPIPFNASLLLNHIKRQGCLGSVSEIFDGDAPHMPQGAIAQAWSVAELLRHWSDL